MTRRMALRTRTFRSDVLAWVLFLLGGAVCVVGGYRWNHRTIMRASDAREGVDDPRIAVLAYDRVVQRPDGRHTDLETLQAHLGALERGGFRPVSLRQLVRFYRGECGLPARSVLLTFDHGYLSTVSAVDPLLREKRWPAALFVMTERQERRDPFFVYWPRLRRLVDSGIWDVGSHGHRGHDPVRVDAEGTEGPFFIRRAWLERPGRQETGPEFAARVAEDHRLAKALLDARGGVREVLAYAPPLRDVNVASLDAEVYGASGDLLRSSYPLVFQDDLFGLNDSRASPHHLKRLRVGVLWSGEELAERLAYALGERSSRDADDVLSVRQWVPAAGRAERLGLEIVATGETRADVWRAGSQWLENWTLEAEVRIDGGEFWVVQQSPDLTEEWRWGGHAQRTYLQRRRPAETVEILASFPARVAPGRWHRLKLVRRGAGLWAEWDGAPTSERPAFLPERWRGSVGCINWGVSPARLRLRKLRFSPFPYVARPLAGQPSEGEVQAAIRDAKTLSALAPEWLEAGDKGLTQRPLDRDLLAILGGRYGWEIVPTVRLRAGSLRSIGSWLPDAFARASAEGWSGLRLDLSGVPRELWREALVRAGRAGRKAVIEGRPLLFSAARWADASTAVRGVGGAPPSSR